MSDKLIHNDDYNREINIGDIVLWSKTWSSGIHVIRSFGTSGNPQFVGVLKNNEYFPYLAHISSPRDTIFKLELEWLTSLPDQAFISALMRERQKVLNGEYNKKKKSK